METLRLFLLLSTCCVSSCWCASSMLDGAVDLAYNTLDGISVTFPLHTKWKQTIKNRGNWGDTDIYLENNDLTQGEHAGTHMDAPAHFIRGLWRIHQIPLGRFSGQAVVIDISEEAEKDKDARVMVEDLTRWEEDHGRIPDGAIVVMHSGWGKFVNDTPAYLGISPDRFKKNPGDFSDLHFPGFSGEAAKWLVDNRNINGVAVDTVSLDFGPSTSFEAHHFFLKKQLWGIENMANVDKLPASGYTIFAVPYNIHDGSGSPTRAFALPTNLFKERERQQREAENAAVAISGAAVAAVLSVLVVMAIN